VKICRPQKFAALGYSPLSPPVNQALIKNNAGFFAYFPKKGPYIRSEDYLK